MPKQVVVVGAGQGGLSAAIHARLLGHDVLVLERQDQIGGKAQAIETHGYSLDPGPSIIILPRLYEAVFRRANRKMEDYLQFQRLDPFTRVYFEGSEPFDLPDGETGCLEALRRVAPQDVPSIQKLLATLDRVSGLIDRTIFDRPFDKPWQLAHPDLTRFALSFDVRASFRELVDRWFQSPVLRAFFYGFPSYSGQSYRAKSPSGLLIPYYMIREGVWYPKGGVRSIPRAFAQLAAELGVELRTGAAVVAFESRNGRIDAVRLQTGERIECDAVISNQDRLTTRRMLGEKLSPPPSYSYFTVHWGIRRRLPGLSHHTLLVPRDYEKGFEALYDRRVFPDPPIVYLNATHEIDPSVAPEGCSNLFAVVTCPAIEDHLDWNTEAAKGRDRVLASLRSFGWELDPGEIDFERIQTPLLFESRDGSYRGSLYGPDEKFRLWGGILPLSVRDPEYPNLTYAGGSVQPGSGLPMTTFSGKFAADALR